MNDKSNALEALKMINDWSKWLITIETGAIAIIGSVIRLDSVSSSLLAKVFASASIVFFLGSIATAALLLLSLPEIAQMLRPDENIWLTRDSIIGRVFRMGTQDFANFESFFFGAGMICFSALIITMIWTPTIP